MAATNFKPLPPGKYLLRCTEESLLPELVNGHSAVWPACEATSDGSWVTFVRAGEEIYRCNAAYAVANFKVEPRD